MHDAIPGNDRLVIDLYVPAKHRTIREDHAVAETAVVTDVSRAHDVVVATDLGRRARLGAAVDLRELADDVAIADAQVALRARKGEVLRQMTNDRAHVDDVVGADLRPPGQRRVCQHARARADPHRAVDDDIWTDVRL